jgi:ribosome-interacting GTPase 1
MVIFTPRKNIKKEKLENALNKLQKVYDKAPRYPRPDMPWDDSYKAMLKAKIKKLKLELIEASKRIHLDGFYIRKLGDATVALVGFPNAGKSSLINAIASTKSKSAQYAFHKN